MNGAATNVSAANGQTADQRATWASPGISLKHGLVFLAALLILNSILASLGSVLWAHFPYWPAFMISALICAFWRWWGLALFVLSPILSCLLWIGGARSFLYVPVNALQAVMILAALRYVKIDPALHRVRDAVLFLCLCGILPSMAGASLAWELRRMSDLGAADLEYWPYVFWWTLENVAPMIVPGIWLHRVVGDVYTRHSWAGKFRPTSWMVTVFGFISPWMLSLMIGGLAVVTLIAQEIGNSKNTDTIALWSKVYEIASMSHVFSWLVLAFSISILFAIGSAIQFAKRSWILEDEISKRLPHRITSQPPSGRYVATVMFTDIRGFTESSRRFPPKELVNWLNRYFDAMCEVAARHHGMVDKFMGDGMMVVFGIDRLNSGSADAIHCSIEMMRALNVLNADFEKSGLPPVKIGVGIHTGELIAGEIGASSRLQYTVIGGTVNVAARLESASKECAANVMPIVLSHETVVDAGLLLNKEAEATLAGFTINNLKGLGPVNAWYITDPDRVLEIIAQKRARNQIAGGEA